MNIDEAMSRAQKLFKMAAADLNNNATETNSPSNRSSFARCAHCSTEIGIDELSLVQVSTVN
jgi:hypothetical protein